jgi:hypothetical protein
MKKVVISPYSAKLHNGKLNPKNYSYWKELVKLLQDKGYHVVQIGVSGEEIIEGVKEICFNASYKQIEELCKEARVISVDNFLPHFLHYIGKTFVNVIWGQSDYRLFGYSENNNIFKSEEYFREKQWYLWTQCEYDENVFLTAEEVMGRLVL